MASADEWKSSLGRFSLPPGHSDAIAEHLAQTRVPLEHVNPVSRIVLGSGKIRPGAGAVYMPHDRSIHLSDPHGVARIGPGAELKYRRTLAHEIGHAVSHHLNQRQFSMALRTPDGRGLLEAHAENYADQATPGTYSGYDYEASRGRMPASYISGRGSRFGNIDPRLSRSIQG